jgi:CheY-like chemotaxis protein
MAKVMLVEDDNNLGEIYQARMAAEGYTVVSAHDGEEALAMAAKEKPDLIVSDVMMPKISGFEMLDILRNTQGLKDTKVIMLTALGQADDKTRAESLGADRYLVKSQVTLEDIVKAAHELLSEGAAPTSEQSTATSAPTAAPVAAPAPTTAPAPMAEPTVNPMPSATPVVPPPAPSNPPAPLAVSPAPNDPPVPSPTPAPAAAPTPQQNEPQPSPQSTRQEADAVMNQINNFVKQPETAQTTSNNDDRLVTDAVNRLVANASPQPAKAPSESASTPTPVPAPAANTAAMADSAPVAHKKIIQPVDNTRPDLSSLLAAEEAKNIMTNPGTNLNLQQAAASMPAPAAHQPGNVYGPSSTPTNQNNTGLDPSSISL